MEIIVPNLYCPFPSRISPAAAAVDQHTSNWLRHYDLLPTEGMYETFSSYKFAWMTSRTYPDADPEFLCLANNLNSWLFVLDDQLDHIEAETANFRDKRFLQKIISDFVAILRNERYEASPGFYAVLEAFRDFWEKIRNKSSVAWQCQFTLSMKATFEAAVWEAENAKKKRYPNVDQYMQMRPFFAGANLGTDMVEPACKISLPTFVLQNEHFQKLIELSRRVVCWSNDLFSLSKEISHGDEHNLVMVLKHQYRLSLEEAIGKAADIHNRDISSFIQLKNRFPSFGDPYLDGEILRYIDHLELMIRGFFDWSIKDTKRYQFIYEAHSN